MKLSTLPLSQLNLSEEVEFSYMTTICDWERVEYGEGKHRLPNDLHRCAKKNRTGFFLLLEGDKLVGYADVWELPIDFYSKLRVGIIDEESIADQYILSRSQFRTNLWYIGSIITDPQIRQKQPIVGAFAFASICNALPNFFHEYSEFPAKILGVGSSPFGKKLLTRWGFSPVNSDSNAIDLRPRFEKIVEKPDDVDVFYLARRKIATSQRSNRDKCDALLS